MYRSIHIDKYRGLDNLNMEDLARINVIAGRNDAGKTTVLEALLLLACGPFAGSNALQVLRPLRNRQPVDFPWNPRESPWRTFFQGLNMEHPIVLSGMRNGKRSTVTLAESVSNPQALTSMMPDTGMAQTAGASLKVTFEVEGSPTSTHIQNVNMQFIGGIGSQVQQLNIAMPLDPPAQEKNLVKSYIIKTGTGLNLEAGYSALRRARRDHIIIDALKGMDSRVKGLEVLVSPTQSELNVEMEDGLLLPLSLLGDGPIMLVQYLLAIEEVGSGGVLLIDEIENGVHWSALQHVWKVLHRAAKRLDVQIFATTHSEECLAAAAQALSGEPHDLRLYRLGRGTDGKSEVGKYEQGDVIAGIRMNLDLR